MKYTREQIKLELSLDPINIKQMDLQNIIRQLLEENDALKADKERIDWIEENPATPLAFHRKSKWFVRESCNYENDCFKTAREAIDAARGVKP